MEKIIDGEKIKEITMKEYLETHFNLFCKFGKKIYESFKAFKKQE